MIIRRMSITLPFAHLNLRWNPFGEPSAEDRVHLAVIDFPEIHPGKVIQFIGESGHGKTTHLLAFTSRYPNARYQRIEESMNHFTEPPTGSILVLDEAQRLPPRILRATLADGRTTVLGTHEDLSSLTDRPVLTIHLGKPSLEKVRAIVGRRIEWARRGPGDVPVVPDTTLLSLLQRHGGDLRAIEEELYHAFQDLREPANVQL